MLVTLPETEVLPVDAVALDSMLEMLDPSITTVAALPGSQVVYGCFGIINCNLCVCGHGIGMFLTVNLQCNLRLIA